MAVQVNYWKCSKERYEQYKKANKIVDTDFYLVNDKENNTEVLYLGLIPLSNNSGELASKEWVEEQISKNEETSQSDWNQNDITAKDYIKNKPFGVEVEEIPEKIYTWDKATVLDNYKVQDTGNWSSIYWIKISNDTPNSLLNSDVSYFSKGSVRNYIVQSEMIINGAGYYKVQQNSNATSILVITNLSRQH